MNEHPHQEEKPETGSHTAQGTAPVSGGPNSAAEQNAPEGTQIGATHEEPPKRHFLGTVPEWLMAIFTAGLCLFAYTTWRTASGQLGVMQSQLTTLSKQSTDIHNQTSAAIQAAKAAQQSANAATSAANTAKATLQQQRGEATSNQTNFGHQLERLDQSIRAENRFAAATETSSGTAARTLADHEAELRANVTLDASVTYGSGAIQIVVVASNGGQTAARQIRIAYAFGGYFSGATQDAITQRQDLAFHDALHSLKAMRQSIAYVLPGHSMTFRAPPRGASDSQWETMKHLPGGWIFVARVTYSDIYGHSHYTNYCSYQVGNDSAIYCADYNDQDVGP